MVFLLLNTVCGCLCQRVYIFVFHSHHLTAWSYFVKCKAATWQPQHWDCRHSYRCDIKQYSMCKKIRCELCLYMAASVRNLIPYHWIVLILIIVNFTVMWRWVGTIVNRQNCFYIFDPEDGGSSSFKSMIPVYCTAHHHIPKYCDFNTYDGGSQKSHNSQLWLATACSWRKVTFFT